MIRNAYDLTPTLDALDAYDRAGSLPMAPGLFPTVVVGDMSSSFAVESVEARFYAQITCALGADPCRAILRATTHPIVVETFRFVGSNSVDLYMTDGTPPALIVGTARKLDVGGIPSTADLVSGEDAGVPGTVVSGPVTISPVTSWFGADRLFIPPGQSLLFSGIRLDVELRARELPSMPRRRR